MGVKNRLLEIRLKLGFQFQKKFAEYLEIIPNQYNRYEKNNGQPSIELLCKIYNKIKDHGYHMEDIVYFYEESK